MAKLLSFLPDKIIQYSFYLLFFLVPLVLTPINYELFEYNKMMLTYGLTTVIIGAWIIKTIMAKRINIRRTPYDLPLLLFLTSQIVSTIFSIDRHVSLFGYYSRFNGGLLSTVSYILLYWAFVNNFPAKRIKTFLKVALASAIFVSVWGVFEHLGVDKNWWVQDVQNRVFSTLGQPNWLAAYLAVLIPLAIGISNIKPKFKFEIGLLGYWVIGLLFYATLLFTKSRSGFLGFWAGDALLWTALIWKYKQSVIRPLLIVNCLLLTVTFVFATPFDQINRFTLSELFQNQGLMTNYQSPPKPTGGSVLDIGITESGTIRQIVWKGAIDIFRHNPLFGTGVETFAFSYYKYRPVEHNMTSEWDFLYNKAHNEYLNYAATTGAFGLGSYLLIILVFIVWNVKNSSKYQVVSSKQKNGDILHTTYYILPALFAGWLSILITNFFGFSVVIIQLLFFLIPAIAFVLASESVNSQQSTVNNKVATSGYILIFLVLAVICYMLYVLTRLWYADIIFADGYHKVRANEITTGYESLKSALEINDEEPFYYDEFSFPAAQLAVALSDEKQATLSSGLTKEAIIASNFAVSHAPENVNFFKTRTRVFYALSAIDEKYFTDALSALEQAKILAPTDPKIAYNLGLLYDRIDKKDQAISELVKATKLKLDYRDAFYALAYLYEKDNKRDLAKDALKYILTKIATDDAEAKKKLEELK